MLCKAATVLFGGGIKSSHAETSVLRMCQACVFKLWQSSSGCVKLCALRMCPWGFKGHSILKYEMRKAAPKSKRFHIQIICSLFRRAATPPGLNSRMHFVSKTRRLSKTSLSKIIYFPKCYNFFSSSTFSPSSGLAQLRASICFSCFETP